MIRRDCKSITKRLELAILSVAPILFSPLPTTAGEMADTPAQERISSTGTPYLFTPDVSYLGPDREEKMDVYRPQKSGGEGLPAVLIIHGGGWTGGDKADAREKQFAEFMIDQGYVAVSINYDMTRYEGKPWRSPRIRGSWPQNIYDCKSALRFLRKHHRDLGIDPERIAVMGGSAGGHLALLTGLSADSDELNNGGLYTDESNQVSCIIDFYGIPDVRVWGGSSFIDQPRNIHPEQWSLASPVEHLKPSSPPIFIAHGTEDKTVNVSQSDNFVIKLQQLGVPHEYHRLEGAPHTFALNPPQKDLRPALQAFLQKYLE